jgi:hypothetical protein
VRWVIITIIFVFDPLAVLLLIASQYTFEWRSRKDDSGGWLRQYEQARAQRIVDNPGYSIDDPKEDEDENSRRETGEEAEKDAETLRTGQDEESIQRETSDDPTLAAEEERKIDVAKSYIATDDAVGDTVPEADTPVADAVDTELEHPEVQTDEQDSEQIIEKKDSSSVTEESTEPSRLTEQELEDLEQTEEWQSAKRVWKDENPSLSLKFFKDLYLEGKIDELPWEKYIIIPKKSYIMKDNGQQIKRTTEEKIISVSDEAQSSQGYIQNEEQNDDSKLWKNIRSKDE